MSAAEALRAARAAGVTVDVDGEDLVLKASEPPALAVLEMLLRDKATIIALLRPGGDRWAAKDWRAHFNDRVAIAEQDFGLPRAAAEARAFGWCVVEWLNRKPIRSSPDRCCWCERAEREDNVLLPFGVESTGHAWLHSACWRPWSEHRRAEAVAALTVMGIEITRFPDDFAKKRGR
jgi:hypothetical protein